MLTITFLCFLLLLCCECTGKKKKIEITRRQGVMDKQIKEYEPCSYDKIVKKQLNMWNNTETLKYYLPKTSCDYCFKPPCLENCSFFTTRPMTIYNNLFEFGLFTFNLPDESSFMLTLNHECFLKVKIIPNYEDSEISIEVHQCETTMAKANTCDTKSLEVVEKDVNFKSGCLFFAFAFTENNKVHYAISVDCTYIPSILLRENRTISITTEKCYFYNEESNVVVFTYKIDRIRHTDGVAVFLPCSTGGYLVKDGTFVFGNACSEIVRDDASLEGFEFVINKLFNGSEDWFFPIPETTLLEENESERRPFYLSKEDEWLDQTKAKKIKKIVPALKNKVRKGCNYVDPKSDTQDPVVTPKFPNAQPGLILGPVVEAARQVINPADTDTDRTTKKPEIHEETGSGDVSRGSFLFLSLIMKIIILVCDLGLIFVHD